MYLTEAGAYPQLPTQPKIFWSFSNLYSYLSWSFWVVSRRQIKIWIRGKKSSVYYWKLRFRLQTFLFSNKLNSFCSNSIFDFSSPDNSESVLLRMTIIAYSISLKMIKKNLIVLGVVDMRQLLLSGHNLSPLVEIVLTDLPKSGGHGTPGTPMDDTPVWSKLEHM